MYAVSLDMVIHTMCLRTPLDCWIQSPICIGRDEAGVAMMIIVTTAPFARNSQCLHAPSSDKGAASLVTCW